VQKGGKNIKCGIKSEDIEKNVLNAKSKIQQKKKINQEQFKGKQKKQLDIDITTWIEWSKDRPAKDNAGHWRGATIKMINVAFSEGFDKPSPDNI
jgi:hypothetical protein